MTKSNKPRPNKPKPKQPQRKVTAAPAAARPFATPEQRHAAALLASVNYHAVPDGGARELDRDVFRMMLARRLNEFSELPRGCGEPLCRRSGRCVGPTMRCHRDFPLPPKTPEEETDMMADVRKLLMERVAAKGER